MNLDLFKHSIPIQVRFSDVDRLDHVNNAVYLTYTELGRVHYLNLVLKRKVDWNEQGFVLARNEIDFKAPVFLRDRIICHTRAVGMGTKSLTLESCIVKEEGGTTQLCAQAKAVLVAMDYRRQESIPLPDEWRKLFKEFEGL